MTYGTSTVYYCGTSIKQINYKQNIKQKGGQLLYLIFLDNDGTISEEVAVNQKLLTTSTSSQNVIESSTDFSGIAKCA